MNSVNPLALVLALAVPAAVAAPAGATSGGVAQTPVATGCPAQYARMPVAYFEALSPLYGLPAIIDAAGNNNGNVCALPLFQLTDDSNPAHLNAQVGG